MFETRDVAPKIDDADIDVVDNVPHWSGWETKCAPNAKGSLVQSDS